MCMCGGVVEVGLLMGAVAFLRKRWRKWLAAFVLFVAGCASAGDLGGPCNKDGTCNSANLACKESLAAGARCFAKTPEEMPKSGCRYESECFCVTCAERCGATGVKSCAYSDTSVWGAKPALCECAR
jgi:hypothetical protein